MLLPLLSAFVALNSAPVKPAALPETITLKVGGVDRTMMVFAPTKESKNAPLVLCYHGHGGGSRQFSRSFRVYDEWPEAWVVYPQGLTGAKGITDAEGVKTGWQKAPGDLDDRDIKFTDAILDWGKKKGIYDPKRTYVTGHSNGGQFTWILAATRGDKFTAFAGCCAPGGLAMLRAEEKPYFIVGAQKDEIVKYEWMTRFRDAMVRKFGEKGEASTHQDGTVWYPAPQPLGTYFYDGGHMLPPEVMPLVVKFFQGKLVKFS